MDLGCFGMWLGKAGGQEDKIVICTFEKVFCSHGVRVCPINRLLAAERAEVRQAAKYNFLKLRNMEEILSTGYRHLV